MPVLFEDFYRGKSVLVTGDTGFKGAWLASWLEMVGAQVHGVGLAPVSQPALWNSLDLERRIDHAALDIRDKDALQRYVGRLRPQVIFHLAAQSLVRPSYRDPLETVETNVQGTANLLHAISRTGYTATEPCAVVIVTSDKCYENRESQHAYDESDPLGGHDLYSASKAAVEILVSAWNRSFFLAQGTEAGVHMATCRAGNVIGGGDWATDRIVPDSVRALQRGEPIEVRNPNAIRPWQHVLEPLSGYLGVAATLASQGSALTARRAWNFGPGPNSERTVAELSDAVVRCWGSGSWRAHPMQRAVHEATFLKLSSHKARRELGWMSVWSFDQAVEHTMEWYRRALAPGLDPQTLAKFTESQIQTYATDAASAGLAWAGATTVTNGPLEPTARQAVA